MARNDNFTTVYFIYVLYASALTTPAMHPFSTTHARIISTGERYPPFPQASALLVRLIKHIHRDLQDDANELLKPFGLNHPEYNILMMLYGSPGQAMTPSQIAGAAGEKSANITRLSDRLLEKKLVSRRASTEDRRKLVVSLSARGQAVMEKLLPAVSTLLHKQTAALSQAETLQLQKLLLKLLQGLQDA